MNESELIRTEQTLFAGNIIIKGSVR